MPNAVPPGRDPPSEEPAGRGHGADLSPEERAAFKARSDAIGKRLEEARGQGGTTKQSRGKVKVDGSGMGRALRVSTELIGGIIVGSAIGWLLDSVLKTAPLFFILFFLLGSAAGMLNVVRSTKPPASEKDGSAGKDGTAARNAPAAKDDDDE